MSLPFLYFWQSLFSSLHPIQIPEFLGKAQPTPPIKANVSHGSVPVRAEKDSQNKYLYVDKRSRGNIPQSMVMKINRTY